MAKNRARRSRLTSSTLRREKARRSTPDPYVETIFMLEGTAALTIGDETREAKAGDIAVVPANTPHRVVNSGNTVLRQIDVHASPKFIQTNLI